MAVDVDVVEAQPDWQMMMMMMNVQMLFDGDVKAMMTTKA